MVTNCAFLVRGPLKKDIPLPELNCMAWTDFRAGRLQSFRTAVRAQITLDGVVSCRVIPHRAVGAGNDTFSATGASLLEDLDQSRQRVLRDSLGNYWTGPETSRTLAMLAGQSEKIEPALIIATQPNNLVPILARTKAMLLLTCRLTAFAAEAALQSDHEGKLAQDILQNRLVLPSHSHLLFGEMPPVYLSAPRNIASKKSNRDNMTNEAHDK